MKNVLIWLIEKYRKRVSSVRRPCCRFVPSCSQYAIEAIEKYGSFKGGMMAIWRVLRCNPLNPHIGPDPVK